TVNSAMGLGHKNVVVSSYGTGAKPLLRYVGPAKSGTAIFHGDDYSQDVAIRGLRLESKYTDYNGMPCGVYAGGKNFTVRELEFHNLADAINTNQKPTGVLAVDNSADTTLREYFTWVLGSDLVYLGTSVGV